MSMAEDIIAHAAVQYIANLPDSISLVLACFSMALPETFSSYVIAFCNTFGKIDKLYKLVGDNFFSDVNVRLHFYV